MANGRRNAVLESIFDNLRLRPDGYEITSDSTPLAIHDNPYNCIAHAADDPIRWWQNAPSPHHEVYWPPVRSDGTLESLIEAFEWIGYRLSNDGAPRFGYEIVALYGTANPDGSHNWTHASKRLRDGRWTSKCGYLHDIAHDRLDSVNCPAYGTAVRFMRRSWLRMAIRWLRMKIFGIRSQSRWRLLR